MERRYEPPVRGHTAAPQRRSRARVLAPWFLACAAACLADVAHAEPRFGDSSWVAPAAPAAGDSAIDGPRVAPPDHARVWETALRTPFRVAFLPLRLVARGLEAGVGRYGERFLGPKPRRAPKRFTIAPRIDLGGSADGDLADVGLGPAMTLNGFPTASAKLKLVGSWTANDRRRARLTTTIGERRPVGFRLRADYDYKPDRRFFGIGNDTQTDRSYFLLENTSVEAAIVLGASPVRQLQIVGGFSGMSPRHGYNAGPSLEERFDPSEVPYFHEATQVYLYGVVANLAALDDPRDPSLGVHGRAELRRASGARDSDPDYDHWLFEGRGYVPVFAPRRVIAARVVYAGIDPTGGTTTLPFYRLVMNEGELRFAGYSSQRFRDRQLMLARIEYRWAIWRRLSAVALYDLGEVAPSVKAFTARGAHASYGGGIRLGVSDASAFRIDVAKGDDGTNAVVRLGSGF